jgi:hypothetical protein
MFHARVRPVWTPKSAPGRVTLNLCFCIWCDLRVTYCISVRPEHETLTHNYPCLGGPGAVSIKKRRDTLCRNCVFASGAICGSYSAFWCVWGAKHRHTIFHARVGLAQFPHKACWDTLRRTCVFASGAIYVSHSSFLCIGM